DFSGPHAVDASGNQHDALYEPNITFYLEGPHSDQFCRDGEKNRAAMFAGGRVRSRLGKLADRYSVSLWLWNGLPNDVRDVSGWFFSRGQDHGLTSYSEHLGIGGTGGHTGRLVFQHGDDFSKAVAGKTE